MGTLLKFPFTYGKGKRIDPTMKIGRGEARNGQQVLTFDKTKPETCATVHELRPLSPAVHREIAYEKYVKAGGLDDNFDTLDEAERLYREALKIDPEFAEAMTNLGNVLYRKGQETNASILYRRAISTDARQPEAYYNLGYMAMENGRDREAIELFGKALAYDDRFADAHFNIAMALDRRADHAKDKSAKSRLEKQSMTHWRRYLELEPSGTWADIAREHIKRCT